MALKGPTFYVWWFKKWLPERKGEICMVLARGAAPRRGMNPTGPRCPTSMPVTCSLDVAGRGMSWLSSAMVSG